MREELRARIEVAIGHRNNNATSAAVTELEEVVARGTAEFGPDDPVVLEAGHQLALSYANAADFTAGRMGPALTLMEQVADARERVLGPAHPDTLATWGSLGALYLWAPEGHEFVQELAERERDGWEQVVADRVATIGADEPETQFARMRLARCYGDGPAAKRILAQISASFGRLAADRTYRLGPVHPDTADARLRYADTVPKDQRITLLRELVLDHELLLGPRDPQTLHWQSHLVLTYVGGAHDVPGAIELAERVLGTAHDVLGEENEDYRGLVTSLSYARNLLELGYGRSFRQDAVDHYAGLLPENADFCLTTVRGLTAAEALRRFETPAVAEEVDGWIFLAGPAWPSPEALTRLAENTLVASACWNAAGESAISLARGTQLDTLDLVTRTGRNHKTRLMPYLEGLDFTDPDRRRAEALAFVERVSDVRLTRLPG